MSARRLMRLVAYAVASSCSVAFAHTEEEYLEKARGMHSPSGWFCNTDQMFELDADGTARIRKFGYVGECTTNRVLSIYKEVQQ